LADVYPPLAADALPRHALMDSDVVDWLMADPGAAATFFREHRVQLLEGGFQTAPTLLILTRDSMPGLGVYP